MSKMSFWMLLKVFLTPRFTTALDSPLFANLLSMVRREMHFGVHALLSCSGPADGYVQPAGTNKTDVKS